MKPIRVLGVLLVALMATAVVASASAAAAEPALYECAKAVKVGKKYTGGYNNKTCGEVNGAHEGKYELQEWNLAAKKGKAKPFKGKGKGANLEIIGVGGVACTSYTDAGKFTGPKTGGEVVAIFKGCELLHHQCESPGESAGTIKTDPLKGEVGYIQGGASKHEVGILLTPESGELLGEFHCAEEEFRVYGGVIGLLTSTKNVFTKEATISFEDTAGVQKYKKLEGGPEEDLQSELGVDGEWFEGEFLESGESTEVTNKGETLELKA
jgi:hypothetical protein